MSSHLPKKLVLLFGHVRTSQPGLQTITIYILPNISQSIEDQTMKFGQLIEYNKKNIIVLKLPYNKNKLYKNLDYWSRDMLNFNFSENGLGLVFAPNVCVWLHMIFQEKCLSCYILLTAKFHCLIVSISWDIGLYVYYNCWLTRRRRHMIWN